LDKSVASFEDAVADIPDGAALMIDGFAGPGGTPQNLIRALRDHGARDLTIISNTAGLASVMGFGTIPGSRPTDIGVLVENNQVKKVVASFPVSPSPSNPTAFEKAYQRGEVELEVVPQGTLAERIRAGGAGIAAFYTPTGAGTLIADGKETRVFDGRQHIMELGLKADFALLRAHKSDTMGNTVYRGTSRNFNAVMATAAAVTILEVDAIVQPGDLEPGGVHTPGIYVNRIVQIA
jgi:3-oxoacid CoA-transferase A subunit